MKVEAYFADGNHLFMTAQPFDFCEVFVGGSRRLVRMISNASKQEIVFLSKFNGLPARFQCRARDNNRINSGFPGTMDHTREIVLKILVK